VRSATAKTSESLFAASATSKQVARIYFSIGSNVDPLKYIELAVHELEHRFGPIDVSPVYQNKALGFEGTDFLNLVVGVDTDKTVDDICKEISAIHELAQRNNGKAKFVSRTLDIDLLIYGQLVTPGPPLRLPRVDVLKYTFALKPLADIAADECHPESGRSYAEHWDAMDQAEHPLVRVEVDITSRGSVRHQPQ